MDDETHEIAERTRYVRSLDERDDPEVFYVVLDADVAHASGPSAKIAPPGSEDEFVYRLQRNLRDATREVEALANEARNLAGGTA